MKLFKRSSKGYTEKELIETLTKLETFLRTVSYKPGYQLGVYSPTDTRPYQIIMTAGRIIEIDSNTGEPFPDGSLTQWLATDYIDEDKYFMKEKNWQDAVYSLFYELETHELQEWYKIDGKCYINPHEE